MDYFIALTGALVAGVINTLAGNGSAITLTILMEVLSPSTRGVDTGLKLVGYFQLPSVVHYLVVDTVREVVIHHSRAGDAIATALLRDGRARLDPPGIEIDIASFFETLKETIG